MDGNGEVKRDCFSFKIAEANKAMVKLPCECSSGMMTRGVL